MTARMLAFKFAYQDQDFNYYIVHFAHFREFSKAHTLDSRVIALWFLQTE